MRYGGGAHAGHSSVDPFGGVRSDDRIFIIEAFIPRGTRVRHMPEGVPRYNRQVGGGQSTEDSNWFLQWNGPEPGRLHHICADERVERTRIKQLKVGYVSQNEWEEQQWHL